MQLSQNSSAVLADTHARTARLTLNYYYTASRVLIDLRARARAQGKKQQYLACYFVTHVFV